jgi:hypothetical protein
MQGITTDVQSGEIRIKFDEAVGGKMTLGEMGLTETNLHIDGGNLRLVIELGQTLANSHFFRMPTIEMHYHEKVGETAWQVEYNGEVVLEKIDHSGNATLLLLNRKKLDDLTHHHQNNLVIHGDFPQEVTLSSENSFLNILEAKGS